MPKNAKPFFFECFGRYRNISTPHGKEPPWLTKFTQPDVSHKKAKIKRPLGKCMSWNFNLLKGENIHPSSK